jgi:Recombination endonuclease VII
MSNENEKTVNSTAKRCGGVTGKVGCGRHLPLNSFGKNKTETDGKNLYCLRCCRAKDKARSFGNSSRMLKKKYGVTVEERDVLVLKQEGRCGRCRDRFSEDNRPQMDHDHECCPSRRTCGQCIRGIACGSCNSRLSVKYCRTNQHTDSYLVRYAVRRAAKEQGVDSALESLLLAIAEDPSESNAVRIRARETGAMLQRVERPVAA